MVSLKFGPTAKIVLVIIIVAVLLFLAWIVLTYNSLVAKQVAVQAQWQQVENVIQLKVDKIPQLINLTQLFMAFELGLLTNLTELQTRWQDAVGIPDQMNISNLLSLTIANWYATAATYPLSIESRRIVDSLFDEISGVENRIVNERLRYNDRVQTYNTAIRTFPGNIVSGMFGFQAEPFFDPIPGGP